jgi:outer membrane protein
MARQTPQGANQQVTMNRVASLVAASLAAGHLFGQGTPQSLTLGDAARLAAKGAAPAVAARYRADQSRGRMKESRASLLPHLSASFSDGKRTFNTASFGLPFPGFDPNGSIIGPVRTVDVRGRLVANVLDPAAYARFAVARSSASSADIEATQAAQSAAAAAAGAYVRAMRAEAQLHARSADSALAAELLTISQRQLDAGVGVALDVTRARAQMAGLRSQLIAARSERDRARLELVRVLGLDAGTPVSLTDSLGVTAAEPVPAEGEALARARDTRADLGVASALAETARRGVWAVKAEHLPSLALFGDDGTTSKDYAHLKATYTYGVQLNVPLFDGFRVSAHQQQANAFLKETEARRRDVEIQVITDVRSSLIELSAGQEQVGAARERLALGEQEVAQARERFRAGVASNADVIIAQLNLTQARTQLVDALAAERMARVSLARAQGRATELP